MKMRNNAVESTHCTRNAVLATRTSKDLELSLVLNESFVISHRI